MLPQFQLNITMAWGWAELLYWAREWELLVGC
jgi:hypothetical protein